MRLRVAIEMLHGLHDAHELRDYDGALAGPQDDWTSPWVVWTVP